MSTIEIKSIDTSKKSDKLKVQNSWPDYLQYNGANLFEIYIDNMKVLEKSVAIGSEYEEADDFDEDVTNTFVRNGQEVYLGYSPDKDVFICGFDIWEAYDSFSAISTFMVFPETGKIEVIETHYCSKMFYVSSSENSGYRKVKSTYPDYIDIRLD